MPSLTVEEFRELVETDLDDDLLQLLLNASWASIVDVLGDLDYNGDRVEIRDGGSRIVFLTRRAGSITSVTETIGDTVTELDPDDWLLRSDGLSLERLSNGTNSPSWLYGVPGSWGGYVTVAFTTPESLANQQRVQVGLVQLDLDRRPTSATSFTIGQYSEAGKSAASNDYDASRAALLASLVTESTWSFA